VFSLAAAHVAVSAVIDYTLRVKAVIGFQAIVIHIGVGRRSGAHRGTAT